ncbi:MAG: DUF1634 domain-containing protein [Anaerolineales bacterium]|nr:DUF1634 domain-containing protein [Anaerolineales bacterium]
MTRLPPEAQETSQAAASEAARPSALEKPLVVTEAEREALRAAPAAPAPAPEAVHRRDVHVAARIDALLAGVLAPSAPDASAERRDLDNVVHRLLVIGLGLSSLLMVIGLALDVILHRQMPTAIPDLREVIVRVVSGRPSGFLSLGLLALLATPIVRVIGSIAAFLYERDWRYALVSLVVLLIVLLSVILGQG